MLPGVPPLAAELAQSAPATCAPPPLAPAPENAFGVGGGGGVAVAGPLGPPCHRKIAGAPPVAADAPRAKEPGPRPPRRDDDGRGGAIDGRAVECLAIG